jgi:uncharacterized protein
VEYLGWIVPAELGVGLTLTLLAASFLASFITIAFGIGGGAFLLAIMASLVPPAVLIPVHGVIQLGSNAGRAALTLRHVFWPAMGWFTVGSLIGVALGAALVVNIPPALVQLGVGLFIIWSVLARPPMWLRRWPVLTGGISTFLTMFFGATGPFVAAYTKSLSVGRHAHVATHAALMTVQHALKTVAFGFLGFAFGAWAGFAVVMIVAGLLGTWAGGAVLNRLSDTRFKRALDILLLLIAARLVWGGIAAL